MDEWKFRTHKDVKRKDEEYLKSAGLYDIYLEIKEILKDNPFSTKRSREKLVPKSDNKYSMRINKKHRVVYTIDKQNRILIIWSAWTHYEKRRGK
jgi:Txe/YoeB family toxin of toxin-antitoxin system